MVPPFAYCQNATQVVLKGPNLLRWVACGGVVAAWPAFAATIELGVLDHEGRGVGNVVVVALLQDAPAATSSAAAPAPAVMDQVARRFVPYILVIQTGTPVAFPNSDTVAHQVYSFSAPKRFQLALYRGHAYPPLVFDKPGLVVLGCNIHDDMLAYIYVTPSPHFGKNMANSSSVLPWASMNICASARCSSRCTTRFRKEALSLSESPRSADAVPGAPQRSQVR